MRVRGTAIFEDLRLVRVADGLHRLRDEVRNVGPASIDQRQLLLPHERQLKLPVFLSL
jgi:hypothetical protein